MRQFKIFTSIVLVSALGSCSNLESEEGGGRGEHGREARGEHSGEGRGEHGGRRHSKEGEESGTELALDQRYDKTRNGARLVLAYDAKSNSFVGTVKNMTSETLKRVRVEVHLSNGKELGPTEPADLGAGAERAVKLTATSKGFERWTAHPEVGGGEHGGEHDREGRGEHRGK